MFKSSQSPSCCSMKFCFQFFLRPEVNNDVIINISLLNSFISLNNIFFFFGAESKY